MNPDDLQFTAQDSIMQRAGLKTKTYNKTLSKWVEDNWVDFFPTCGAKEIKK
jgi:hypothetical protein